MDGVRTSLAAVGAALLLVLAVAASAADVPLTETCIQAEDDASVVQFSAEDGTALVGVDFGSGPRGVLLAHKRSSDLCEWRHYALRLRDLGYHVLAFDFRGYGSSSMPASASSWGRVDEDVAAGVAELRALGATKVIAVGASMGATAALAATARLRPQADGVVSLSAARAYGPLNAVAAVRTLGVPVLFVGARRDATFVADARRLFRSARVKDKRLLVVGGRDHGTQLLDDPAGRRVRPALESFLARVEAD
jgi:pimeloyl-ACP methyl ester carboxylesterase